MITCHEEPTLDELLSDPVIEAVMDADGIEPAEVETLMRRVHTARMEDA